MAALLTRPEMRDAVRRTLQIVPPIDAGVPGAVPGQQPTNAPWPSNEDINQALQQAISDINRETGFHVSQVSVPVNGVLSSALGPLQLSMETLNNSTSLSIGNINEIRRCLWLDSQSNSVPILLNPTNRYALDRSNNSVYYQIPPAFPMQWFVEGYTLNILPSPTDDGTLLLVVGSGVIGLQGESDPIDQLPTDYQWVVQYQCVVRLSKMQVLDTEGQARAAMFIPDAERGMKELKSYNENLGGPQQPQFAFNTYYRSGYGTRRVVR